MDRDGGMIRRGRAGCTDQILATHISNPRRFSSNIPPLGLVDNHRSSYRYHADDFQFLYLAGYVLASRRRETRHERFR